MTEQAIKELGLDGEEDDANRYISRI